MGEKQHTDRPMTTRLLGPQDMAEAVQIIREGGLLAIPTETVYGLGANGLDERAVAAIFTAKGRPQDNPLILHLPDGSWLDRYCANVPAMARRLAERFWPGPLTMILHRNEHVPDIVTAGLDTVGVRCPDNELTRQVIRLADVPVAAPSANRSGRPSPTTAHHVMDDMSGRIDAVLDGGPCAVGVESTIIDLTAEPPRLLRPGGVTVEELEAVVGPVAIDPAVTRQMAAGESPKAPGMKYRHYAPKAPVTAVKGQPERTADYIAGQLTSRSGVICFDEFADRFPDHITRTLGPVEDKAAHAHNLFDALRFFDGTDVADIWAQCPDEEGLGLAVSNRLSKAAGFHIIEIGEGTP